MLIVHWMSQAGFDQVFRYHLKMQRDAKGLIILVIFIGCLSINGGTMFSDPGLGHAGLGFVILIFISLHSYLPVII